MMDKDALNWIMLIVALCFIAIFAAGIRVGGDNKQDDLLTQYCLHAEYERYIEVDGSYYCNKGDDLLLIDWMVK